MKRLFLLSAFMALLLPINLEAGVQVIGEMRRMFTEHDIGPNADIAKVNQLGHLYALGPLAGLRGEVTVLDSQVFVSTVRGKEPNVLINPNVQSAFLVYDSVSAWSSTTIPTNVITELEIADFLDKKMPQNTRSAFRIRGTVVSAKYHIQNYKGEAAELTHEAHDKAKVFYEVSNMPIELVGFFTNRAEDGGAFVHRGQTTHIHLISEDRKQMGHLELVHLQPGATLLLPENVSLQDK